MSPHISIGSTDAVGGHKSTSDLILRRIAEAAGTAFYHTRKASAFALIGELNKEKIMKIKIAIFTVWVGTVAWAQADIALANIAPGSEYTRLMSNEVSVLEAVSGGMWTVADANQSANDVAKIKYKHSARVTRGVSINRSAVRTQNLRNQRPAGRSFGGVGGKEFQEGGTQGHSQTGQMILAGEMLLIGLAFTGLGPSIHSPALAQPSHRLTYISSGEADETALRFCS